LTINLGNGFASFGLRSALIPLFVVEALALGRQWTGYGLLVSAIIQGVLLLPAGRMADTRGRKPALILGTAATTIGFVVLSLTHSLGMFLLSMAILGAGAAYLASAPAAVVGDMTGGKRGGPIVSTYQMMSDVGAVAAPLIAGKIVDSTGSFAVGFLVGAAILGIGFLMSLFIRETLATRTSSQPEAEMIPNMNGQGIDPDESPVHIA
jgi:MFS family permease